MRRALPMTSLLLALAAAGCGGKGSTAAAPSPSTSTSAPAPTPSPSSAPPTASPSSAAPTSAPSGGSFAVKIGPNGVEDPKLWPDACRMLTDAELHAIVPKSTKVVRQGSHGQFLGGGETPHFVECKFNLPLLGDTSAQTPSYLDLSLRGVADPKAVKAEYDRAEASQRKVAKKYPDQFHDYGSSLGADDCFWDGNEVQCRAGAFSFWLGGLHQTEGDYRKAQQQWRPGPIAAAIRTLATKMT